MKLINFFSFLLAFLPFSPLASAVKLIESKSLVPCQDNSNFTATLFNIAFTPDNYSASVKMNAISSINGFVKAEVELLAYGITALKEKFDPCKLKGVDLGGLCPMNEGPIEVKTNFQNISPDMINKVPGVAYGIPDIDLKIRIIINSTKTKQPIACVEAQLSNGKTVYHKGVGWAVAVIAGLGLVASAVTSGLGNSNTAAHVAAGAISLFGFFQAQAMIGMTSVTLPPIVQSWTQNFQWSMGIIRVGFLQRLATWYQRSTGGDPTKILRTLSESSVQMQRRSLDTSSLLARGYDLVKRTNNEDGVAETTGTTIVRGIKRVGFRARIEESNIFMTGLLFFVFFVAFVMILVAGFKGVCELLAKSGRMKSNKFQDFRNGWKIVMRGILFRLTLLGFPQMAILCLWEITQRDSPAEVVLAVFMLLSILGSLGWAAFKVISLAKKSVEMHKNPAYILYSDPSALNKWGFLYVQYRATAYYCVVPLLVYTLVKAMFIGLAQDASIVQAFALFVLELAILIGAAYLRPWMDKKTNIFNIAIVSINFFNVILLLFFTGVFKQPGAVTGVMGVIFFIANVIFALVLVILVLIASGYAFFSKNPETRYQPMRDDRGSFIKSQTQLTTELDALGATARGEGKRDLEDDITSFSGNSLKRAPTDHNNNGYTQAPNAPPRSPIDNSVPLFPMSDAPNTGHGLPPPNPYHGAGGYNSASPSPYDRSGSANSNPHSYRMQNSGTPWQRGAGYDH